jgi:hypothetical protein
MDRVALGRVAPDGFSRPWTVRLRRLVRRPWYVGIVDRFAAVDGHQPSRPTASVEYVPHWITHGEAIWFGNDHRGVVGEMSKL